MGARKKKETTDPNVTVPVSLDEPTTKEMPVPFTDDGVPSARPTAVPNYDVEALAAASSWETSLPQQRKKSELPLDLAVPIRLMRASVDGAPLRAAFLLSHVDDRLSISEIASSAQIPLTDAIESFVLLSDLGIVELRGASGPPSKADGSSEDNKARPPTPKSGLRPKT
jgi:hypothetical protein